MKLIKGFLIILIFLYSSVAFAQTEEDIAQFLKQGRECYNKGDLMGAAIEFENVILIDKKNFEARLWLCQVYTDLKDTKKALNVLREAARQAPDHPKVIQLQKLLGAKADKKVVEIRKDPVVHEALTLLGSGTSLRKYGLVIPEKKVVPDRTEEKLIVFDDIKVKEKKVKEKEIDLSSFSNEDSPLASVFEAWETSGITDGLDEYFKLILKDPSIAEHSDKGLLEKGADIYQARFAKYKDDTEARYYAGMLNYINGMFKDAADALDYFRAKPGKYRARLKKVFIELDKWKALEKERLAALKREEEERLALELAEKAQKEAAAEIASIDKRAKKGKSISDDASSIHQEGFKLYKKGKLDEAILKFNEAIAKRGDDAEFHYHLGLAWTDKGLAGDNAAFDKAVISYQRVISLAPDGQMAKDAKSMIRDIESAKRSLGGE